MTSREKLLQLRHDFYTNSSLDYDSISYFASIEKDLEVLEALKRNLCFYGCCIDFYREEEKNINTKMNTNDYQIVKEWLENEAQ